MGVGIDPFGENQPMTGMTLGSLTRRWSPALKALFLGLARNGLSAHPDEVPLSGFLAFLRFYTLLRRDAWNFAYAPDDGGRAICEPLSARIQQLGGAIRLGCRVNRIIREDETWLIKWDSPAGPESIRSEHIILATDAPGAQKILQASFGTEVEDLYFPRALSNAIIRLWFDTKPTRSSEAGIFTGEFILHNYFWLDRFYNDYRRWSRTTGGSVLEAHIYGPPEVLAQPDALILSQAMLDVFRVWPGLRNHRIGQHLQRNPETHTLPSVGPAERHLGIETRWAGLFCAGDWVRHPNGAFFLERACVTGIEAANAVLHTHGLKKWDLVPHLPPEPFAGWIERLMVNGRKRRRARRGQAQPSSKG
jgi:isorenieratene synthase